ncbi:MAG: antibiotic biosynthesis monooxygenase [Acholeplasma sp.]|nr:antibiotic biosynthesis monooxygenase [Acholeplasma sp.]
MYIIEQSMKFEKGYKEVLLAKYQQPFILQQVEGFIKREVLINESSKDYDLLIIKVYFSSRQAYINWEGSDLHKSMHKGPHGHKKTIEGLIESKRTAFHELVTLYHK